MVKTIPGSSTASSPRSRKGASCGSAGRDLLDRARLQGQHRCESALLLLGRRADDHRSLELASVTVDVRARTADQHVAALNAVALHKTVGHRRGAAGDKL